MSFDFRWLKRNGETVLQVRSGKVETVGNPKHDPHSDRSNTGKYCQKVKWGKWKDVRVEEIK